MTTRLRITNRLRVLLEWCLVLTLATAPVMALDQAGVLSPEARTSLGALLGGLANLLWFKRRGGKILAASPQASSGTLPARSAVGADRQD
jgi:hypothetical protein